MGWSGGLALRCSGSCIVCLGVRGTAASALFVHTQLRQQQAWASPGEAVTASALTGTLQVTAGEVQANPITPQLMGLPVGCGPHLESAQVTAECSSGCKM